MAVQISTTTFSPSAGLGPDPIRTLVPVDFADPAVDRRPSTRRPVRRSRPNWAGTSSLAGAGRIVVLPVQAYRELAIGATRLKSLQIREHVFDLDLKHVYRDGREIPLTPTEWAICEMLVRRVDRVIPQNEMLLRVWAGLSRRGPPAAGEPGPPAGEAGARAHPGRRRRLHPDPDSPRHGYWMASEARS